MTYFAIGKNAWGKGATAKDAIREMRKHLSSADKNRYIVYATTDPNAYVNQVFGTLYSAGTVREVERKGLDK